MHPKRLEARIQKAMNQANRDYDLIRPGDKIMVAISGGKDSYGLLWGLQFMQKKCPFEFGLVAYHLDQGQPGHDTSPVEAHLAANGVPFEIEYEDTYTKVIAGTKPGKIYCSLCSRFRRAILYRAAIRHGCNKIALGHHADDIAETLLLNLFFSGQLKTMPPRLLSDDGVHQIIRPLAYVAESELKELAELHAFPIIPCNLCGSQEAQRVFIKRMLNQLEGQSPHIKRHILAAAQNVKPSHLLDANLYPWLRGESEGPFEPPSVEEAPLVQLGRRSLSIQTSDAAS